MRVHDRGFALLIVLLAVAALFAMAVRSAVSSRSTTLEVGVVHDRVVGERGARGAAVLAIRGMLRASSQALEDAESERDPLDDPLGRRSDDDDAEEDEGPKDPELPAFLKELLGDKLKQVEQGAQDAAKGSSFGSLADGAGLAGRTPSGGITVLQSLGLPVRPISISLDGRRYTVRLTDAAGQFPLNGADEKQLLAFFRAKGLETIQAQTLTDHIIDWRDGDNIPRARGAEQEVYERLGIKCRNAPFAALEELLYLPPVTRELFAQIRSDLSLTMDPMVHAGSASREVLMSVDGLTPDVVDRIVSMRNSSALTAASLESALPLIARDDLKKRIRFEPSSVVRLSVDAVDEPPPLKPGEKPSGSSPAVTRFEGIAIIDDKGLRELGLRAIQ